MCGSKEARWSVLHYLLAIKHRKRGPQTGPAAPSTGQIQQLVVPGPRYQLLVLSADCPDPIPGPRRLSSPQISFLSHQTTRPPEGRNCRLHANQITRHGRQTDQQQISVNISILVLEGENSCHSCRCFDKRNNGGHSARCCRTSCGHIQVKVARIHPLSVSQQTSSQSSAVIIACS